MQGLLNEVQEYRDRMVEWRRNIHSCPETGFHLPKTSAMVAGVLEKLDFRCTPDLQKALSWESWKQAGREIP
mgnify:CR=1 FL=1